jgi:hypothetical protein
MEDVVITLPQFITHAQISKNKFKKISGQRMFVGVNPYIRDAIVKQMHHFIESHLPEDLQLGDGPYRIRMKFHAPANYGTVRRIKGKLSWKPPKDGYVTTWDADNMWIWGKCFNDVLTNNNILHDDNVHTVRASGEVEYCFVETLEERKIEFIISKYIEDDTSKEFTRRYSGKVPDRATKKKP